MPDLDLPLAYLLQETVAIAFLVFVLRTRAEHAPNLSIAAIGPRQQNTVVTQERIRGSS